LKEQITELVASHDQKIATAKNKGTYKKGVSINDFNNFQTSMKYY